MESILERQDHDNQPQQVILHKNNPCNGDKDLLLHIIQELLGPYLLGGAQPNHLEVQNSCCNQA